MHSVVEHYIHHHLVYAATNGSSVVINSTGVGRSTASVEGLLCSHCKRIFRSRNGMVSCSRHNVLFLLQISETIYRLPTCFFNIRRSISTNHFPQLFFCICCRLPVKTLQLEQMAVVGRAEEPSVVASRMQLVFSTLEVSLNG